MRKESNVFTTAKDGMTYFAKEVDEYVGMLREAYEELWNETEELRQEMEKEIASNKEALVKSEESLSNEKEALRKLEKDALEAKETAQSYLNELTKLKKTMSINNPEDIKAAYESRIGEFAKDLENLTKKIRELQEKN